MDDLPRWEYVIIILCAEIILAVIITLIICWKCRWSKKTGEERNDEKKPLPEVDDLSDDIFTKEAIIVVGQPPAKHDYTEKEPAPWPILRNSKAKPLDSPRPKSVGFKNEAFIALEEKNSNSSVKLDENILHKTAVVSASHHKNEIEGLRQESRVSLYSERTISNTSFVEPNTVNNREEPQIIQTKTDSQLSMSSNNEEEEDNEIRNSLLIVTKHQDSSSSLESTRALTPVEFDKTEDHIKPASPERQKSSTRNRSPLIVRSADDSYDIFNEEALRNQYARDVQIVRSPPPSYSSATGHRTNPRMGQPSNLTGGDENSGRTVRNQPLWETRTLDLRRV